MLNATYRTLSATTNGLNLGTRTLAAKAGAINVATTLRLALDPQRKHQDSLRFGVRPSFDPAIMGIDPMAMIPSSPGWPVRYPVGQRVEVLVESPPVCSAVVDGPVVPIGRLGGRAKSRRLAAPGAAKAATAAAGTSTCPVARCATGG